MQLDILIPARTIEEADLLLLSIDEAIARLAKQAPDARAYVTIALPPGATSRQSLAAGGNNSRSTDAKVAASPRPGRGNQLAAAAAQTTGDVILMLHADAQLAPEALVRLHEALTNPAVDWGILGHRYPGGGLLCRIAHVTNRLRFHLLGIAYGDQGIFVRRATLKAAGGIPEIPLMEDVELSMRLRPFAKPISLGACQSANPERLQRGGLRYLWQCASVTTWWLLHRRRTPDLAALAAQAYRRYYGAPPS